MPVHQNGILQAGGDAEKVLKGAMREIQLIRLQETIENDVTHICVRVFLLLPVFLAGLAVRSC